MSNLMVDYNRSNDIVLYNDLDDDYFASIVNLSMGSNKIIPAISSCRINESNVNYEKCVLDILLKDRTTNRNIIWATNDYIYLKEDYKAECEISIPSITGIIQSRIFKGKSEQTHRIRDKAEVFTPSWICNEQNNLIDNLWFGYKDVFNVQQNKSWITNTRKISFPIDKTWEDYVDARRMEITCGEAPYLVSRYDAVTGKSINVEERIGLLDRKLRVVNENTDGFKDWFKWVQRAYQSTYGYEYQGDSLFIARKNLLYTFVDNLKYKFDREPDISELKVIASIISWNIWQMDGITYTIPLSGTHEWSAQLTIFDFIDDKPGKLRRRTFCKIKDWRSKKIMEYVTLLKGERNGA